MVKKLELLAKCLRDHMAVRMKDCIVVMSSVRPLSEDIRQVWICNLWIKKWKKCSLTHGYKLPNICCKSAVAIDTSIYILDGWNFIKQPGNVLWKMSRKLENSFDVSIIHMDSTKTPSPRDHHCSWEYGGEMWIFGGFGSSPNGYLHEHGDFDASVHFWYNNQLFAYNPSQKSWKNAACFGHVPSPRSHAAAAIINDRVWIYGGTNTSADIMVDFYVLNMNSLTWTKMDTITSKPLRLTCCSLTPATPQHLVLHGYSKKANSTWILDVESYEWKKHPSSVVSSLRSHTGTTGLNGEVIILGHSKANPIFSVTLEPKTLQQMAMKIIYRHKTELPWIYLPSLLKHRILGNCN